MNPKGTDLILYIPLFMRFPGGFNKNPFPFGLVYFPLYHKDHFIPSVAIKSSI